uniref:Thioredoxin family protein n=1 Tax=Roseihalotalea indica TaxID=2867963 RepID=A0AA49GS60_9BACT|nr:thioredoxin family protein [Tunicatimonas sp. TK19036]
MVRILLIGMFITVLNATSIQAQFSGALTFQQLDSLQQIEAKPVLVFIYAEWCRYCKAMEHTTFQNEEIATWLDSAFYMVTMDAESQQDITIRNQIFHYQPSGNGTGQHELAQVLGQIDGKLTLPTLCFLNADYQIIYQQAGFTRAPELITILETLNTDIRADRL